MRSAIQLFVGLFILVCSCYCFSVSGEVWLLDQFSFTSGDPPAGGKLYIFNDAYKMANTPSETIDLGGQVLQFCVQVTHKRPVRPHMIEFSHSGEFAAISFLASAHVVVVEVASRKAVGCVDVSTSPSDQAHAVIWSRDDSYLFVFNQNGKKVQRILTNLWSREFVLDSAATIDLATCTTPSGAPCQTPSARPDTAPICGGMQKRGLVFTTLRGGGGFIINSRVTPMKIVAEYDNKAIKADGCGGVNHRSKMYINSGKGGSSVYAINFNKVKKVNPSNHPKPTVVLTSDGINKNYHGMAIVGNKYLWVADQLQNEILIVDTRTDKFAYRFSIKSNPSSNPLPDIMHLSSRGNHVYMSTRGPKPLTGVPDQIGTLPGVLITKILGNGARGRFVKVVPVPCIDSKCDPHGLGVLSFE